ncbi:hypothetical protein LOTGIDRAFT_153031 [Lottia gigantea]|uniref:Uncharacterized protein n=1 Tax=Lottia gigantea TaxID=225164 RepID=V4A262_LOTGI|nr:hypothetical protein LOTGIDRAFT_153031 [Lottia gigantea]ESO97923.1 hypothetical protein LOTGIDRAFT_153031 [Lottia gigantea]
MAAKSFLQMNQLQFNLNAPPSANNLIYKQRKPEPIMIERLGQSKSKRENFSPTSLPLNSSMQFSVLSEDKLSAAVLLARRDFRNQKRAEEMRAYQPKSPQQTRGRPTTKGMNSKVSQPANKKTVAGKTTIKFKDEVKNVHRSVPQPVPIPRVNPVNLPVTTNSPPTRDTDRYPIHKVHIAGTEGQDEISRMQKELESYLNQIKTIEEKAITEEGTEFLRKRRGRSKDGYLSDEEDLNRKAVRSEEQTVRTARNLYNLRQQVKQIQKDFLQLGSNDIKQTKKSQAISKLTAAHRGALRSMQAFVHQLPHQDFQTGLPSSYRELALLIRQLTMLTTQIQRGNDSSVNNQLIAILDKVDELNDIWRSDMKTHNSSKQHHNTSVRPPFVLDFKQDKPAQLHQKFYGKENKMKEVVKRPVRNEVGIRKPVSHYRGGSPSRKTTLRAGINSLLKSSTVGTKKPGVMFNIPNKNRNLGPKTSVILPGKLQSKRERVSRPVQPVVSDTHFADPTLASNLKAVNAAVNPLLEQRPSSAPSSPERHKQLGFSPSRHHKAPWIPPGSPTSCGRSPSGERRSRSESPSSSRRYLIEDINNSFIRRLFPDKPRQQILTRNYEERKHSQHVPRPRSVSPRPWADSPLLRSRSPSPTLRRRRRALSDSLIEDIADEVRRKLNLNTQKDNNMFTSYPLASKANKMLRRSEEDLTDVIVDDVLRDTVHNLNHIQSRDKIHQHAIAIQDSPTLNNLIYRLQQMEDEQEDIRRRWQCVDFDDPRPKTRHFTSNEIASERPRSPTGIQISYHRQKPQSSSSQFRKSSAFSKEVLPEPILYTKPKSSQLVRQEKVYQQASSDSVEDILTVPPYVRSSKQLSIPQTIVNKIEDNREDFQLHLKKISHHPMGKFNPWKLVEEITDQIMDECLIEIAGELDEMNEDMANHMYKSEFLLSNGQSPSSPVIRNINQSEDVLSEQVSYGEWEKSEDEQTNSEDY